MKSEKITKSLHQITKPFRYIGSEFGAIKKDLSTVDLHFALVSPDTYELGMSHLGLKIIYDILNKQDGIYAERVFSPWIDMEEFLRRESISLGSLESNTPLKDFDIIGFSVLYELSYTNILNILNLSGIPFYSAQRDQSHPLLMAGGASITNPEPIADFFDIIFIGDGEEGVLEIVELAKQHKGKGRTALLEELAKVKGAYIPSFFKTKYHGGVGAFLNTSVDEGKNNNVQRRVVKDLQTCDYPISQPVPYGEAIHNRLSVEVSRGCSRGCRFCQAGYIYRPVRERSIEIIDEIIDRGICKTGYDEVSLLSLSSGDYSELGKLLKTCRPYLAEKISISMPSLRAGTVNKELLEEIKRVRKTGFTIAPEAGSQKMRDRINKNLTEEEIIDTCKLLFEEGWSLIKLYFMIGLPGEEQSDIDAIVELVKKILRIGKEFGRVQLHVSISSFVPKPHTPFQWARQNSIDELKEKLDFLKNAVTMRNVKLKWQEPDISFLEGVMSRGDRKLSAAIVNAWEMGARFDGWTEQFNLGIWLNALSKAGIDGNTYLGERERGTPLPWSHINVGVTEKFLSEELDKSLSGLSTKDCRRDECYACGVCSKDIQNRNALSTGEQRYKTYLNQSTNKGPFFRYRLTYKKAGKLRFLSHLDLLRTFSRAIRRAELPIRYSEGFNPHPKLSFGPALSLGLESFCEMLDIELTNNEKAESIKTALNTALPEELAIVLVKPIAPKKPAITCLSGLVTYQVELNPEWGILCSGDEQYQRLEYIDKLSQSSRVEKVNEILGMDEVLIKRKEKKSSNRRKKKQRSPFIDIRPMLVRLALGEPCGLCATFEVEYLENSYILKPWDILKVLFDIKEEDIGLFSFRKTHFSAGLLG